MVAEPLPAAEIDPKDLPEVSQEDAEQLVDEPVPEPPKEPIEQ
jgi:hypothetical protein